MDAHSIPDDAPDLEEACPPTTDRSTLVRCDFDGIWTQFTGDVFVGCNYAVGSVALTDSREVNLAPLEPLQMIEGDLVLSRNRQLRSLDGLENLEAVGGDVRLISQLPIESLIPLGSLRTVNGLLEIQAEATVESLEGLGNLTCVGALDLLLTSDLITDLGELSSLERIDGDLTLTTTGVPDAEVRSFLDGVDVGGTVTVNGETWE